MASDTRDNSSPGKQGKPGESGHPQYEHGPGSNAAPKHLYDLNQDNQTPGKAPATPGASLQPGITDQGGNGTQDRRPGRGRRSMSLASAPLIYDSSVLHEDDRPR